MGCERGEKIKIIKVELFHFHSQLRLRKYVTLRGAYSCVSASGVIQEPNKKRKVGKWVLLL